MSRDDVLTAVVVGTLGMVVLAVSIAIPFFVRSTGWFIF